MLNLRGIFDVKPERETAPVDVSIELAAARLTETILGNDDHGLRRNVEDDSCRDWSFTYRIFALVANK